MIIVDDEDRENEGDLIMAAEFVTAEHINFMAKHGRGLICMPMTAERIDELGIPMMVPVQQQPSAHPSRSRSKPATASPPASPPPTAPAPSRC